MWVCEARHGPEGGATEPGAGKGRVAAEAPEGERAPHGVWLCCQAWVGLCSAGQTVGEEVYVLAGEPECLYLAELVGGQAGDGASEEREAVVEGHGALPLSQVGQRPLLPALRAPPAATRAPAAPAPLATTTCGTLGCCWCRGRRPRDGTTTTSRCWRVAAGRGVGRPRSARCGRARRLARGNRRPAGTPAPRGTWPRRTPAISGQGRPRVARCPDSARPRSSARSLSSRTSRPGPGQAARRGPSSVALASADTQAAVRRMMDGLTCPRLTPQTANLAHNHRQPSIPSSIG